MESNSNKGSSKTDNELKIVMVGKTGIGKSASGNTILGKSKFESKFGAKSMTVNCSKGKAVVDGQKVAVIDTPGLFDTRFNQDKTAKDICQCFTYAAPGPHVFLVVIRLGRYTDEEMQTVQKIQEIFGQAADRYSMVLFTGGDTLQMEGITIEKFLSGCEELQELVSRCNGEYHVFNNKQKDPSQVTELIQKIKILVQKNAGSYYTNQMFQEAEKAVEEEKRRILEEKAVEIQREKEELQRKLEEKFEIECLKIQKQFKEEKEKEVKKAEEERAREKQEMILERKREMGLRDSEKKREKEERERERLERESEKNKEKEERERERLEREYEKKKEKEDREMDKVEREREKEREKEELKRMITELREKHKREMAEEGSKLQNKFENEARDEAENSNPFYKMLKSGKELVVEGFANLVEKMSNLF